MGGGKRLCGDFVDYFLFVCTCCEVIAEKICRKSLAMLECPVVTWSVDLLKKWLYQKKPLNNVSKAEFKTFVLEKYCLTEPHLFLM